MSEFSSLKRHESPISKTYKTIIPEETKRTSSPESKRNITPIRRKVYVYASNNKKGGKSKKSKYSNNKKQRKTRRKYNK